MKHTYTLHVTFEAETDAQALLVRDGLAALMPGIPATDLHLTDADDWAEHVTPCNFCSAPVERQRAGIGSRVHAHCAPMIGASDYPIVDTH